MSFEGGKQNREYCVTCVLINAPYNFFLAEKKNCEIVLELSVGWLFLTLAIFAIGPGEFIKRILINLRIHKLVLSITSFSAVWTVI